VLEARVRDRANINNNKRFIVTYTPLKEKKGQMSQNGKNINKEDWKLKIWIVENTGKYSTASVWHFLFFFFFFNP
jgi:hypothetical protein